MKILLASTSPRRGLLTMALVVLLAGPSMAATLDLEDEERGEGLGRGEPMEQRFLDSGVSVLTTARGPSCVASARIDIAASAYRDEAGQPVPFDRIVRSPAASIQAPSLAFACR